MGNSQTGETSPVTAILRKQLVVEQSGQGFQQVYKKSNKVFYNNAIQDFMVWGDTLL